LDAAARVDLAHANVLLHPDAERELRAKFQVVRRRVDALDVGLGATAICNSQVTGSQTS